jgi:hypothetical protein
VEIFRPGAADDAETENSDSSHLPSWPARPTLQ